MGRPQGERDSKLSLIAVGEELASLLEMPIKFSDNCISTDSIDTSISLKQGEVHLLENLRFHPGEQDNEMEFSWYVNEDSEKIIKSCDLNVDKHNFYSQVSREEAQKLMVNSTHCLLSIGNKNPNQIPSKVVEYLATGKPIIHFTEIDNDPVIKLSEEFDNLITLNKSVEEENLSLLIEEMFNKIQKFDIDKFISNYTAKSIINKLDII